MSIEDVFRRYQSDKNTFHSYGPVYESILAPIRLTATSVLEVGVKRGESLRVWRDYFPNANVVGLDVDANAIFAEDRITTHLCDATNATAVNKALAGRRFDFMVEDGSHRILDQVITLFYLWPLLRPGGVYVIEDIDDIETFRSNFAVFDCVVHDLRHVKGRWDDVLVVLRKPGRRLLL